MSKSHELRKDDPVYYKPALRGLISEAKENGLTIGYETEQRDGEISCIRVLFGSNDTGEIAGSIVYGESRIRRVETNAH